MQNNFYYEQGSHNVFHINELLTDIFNAQLQCQYMVPTAGIPIYSYSLQDQYGMPLATIPDGLDMNLGTIFIYPNYKGNDTFTIEGILQDS